MEKPIGDRSGSVRFARAAGVSQPLWPMDGFCEKMSLHPAGRAQSLKQRQNWRDAYFINAVDEGKQMGESAQNLWVLGSSYTLGFLAVLQIIDLGLTLLHSLQERKGRLWRYFGAIAGVKIPDNVGQVLFFWGLTLSLWIVGLLGISGTVMWQAPLAFGCLGAIIGCRLSDSLFSHILLNSAGYRPNPGLSSVPLYFAESVLLGAVFLPAIREHTFPVAVGFILGVLAFYAVLPGLKTFGPLVFQPVEPWKQGAPQPNL